jgi:hypothetical protein
MLMRFECEQDDIPRKWHTVDLVPGMEDDWIIIRANGIMDPSGVETTMNYPAPHFKGSFQEAEKTMNSIVAGLEQAGYKKVQKQDNDAT